MISFRHQQIGGWRDEEVKGQTKSKLFFQADVSSKKWTNEFNFTTSLWHLRSTCFRSFFGRNWRQQKDISKSTELYKNLCLVHLLSQNLVWAYSTFLSMLNFLCTLKIILVYSKVRFYYINWLIWVHLKCFEYSLKIWVYLKI